MWAKRAESVDLEASNAMIVRKLRLQRGWTQEHLAALTGLSVRSIQRVERGHPFSLETRKALAAVFEVEQATFDPGAFPMTNESSLQNDEAKAIDHVRGIKEFYTHLLMYALFVTIFGFTYGFADPRIFWGAIGWGVGVLAHALNAFEIISFFGPAWERRQIEKRIGRKL